MLKNLHFEVCLAAGNLEKVCILKIRRPRVDMPIEMHEEIRGYLEGVSIAGP